MRSAMTELSRSLQQLVEEDLPPVQQIALMRGLAVANLTDDLLVTAVEIFRTKMIPVKLDADFVVDLCGTGGDRSGSFNISTTASFVAAAAGIKVAKHGNVSITSRSGGIDLLRALGVQIPENADGARRQFDTYGLAFLFAQNFHPIFKKFTEARRALAGEGIKTIFNVLGPLLNPAHVNCSVMGVFSADLVEMIARVKLRTGQHCAYIAYGNGMDEFTLTGPNKIAEIKDKEIISYSKTPQDFGMKECGPHDLQGGGPDENAAITLGILDGSIQGAKRNIVILNAAMAILAGMENIGFHDAVEMAREAMDSRKALQLLQGMCA